MYCLLFIIYYFVRIFYSSSVVLLWGVVTMRFRSTVIILYSDYQHTLRFVSFCHFVVGRIFHVDTKTCNKTFWTCLFILGTCVKVNFLRQWIKLNFICAADISVIF